MDFGPILETQRLRLRVPQAGDFERFAEVLGSEEAARYIGGHQPRAAAWRRFLQMPGAWVVQGFGMFSVIEKDSGRWLGQAGPWKPDGWPGNEIGWTFHPDAWGKGYATEAARLAVRFAFETLGLAVLAAGHFADNPASGRVLQKLGFTYTEDVARFSKARDCDVACKMMTLDRAHFASRSEQGNEQGGASHGG